MEQSGAVGNHNRAETVAGVSTHQDSVSGGQLDLRVRPNVEALRSSLGAAVHGTKVNPSPAAAPGLRMPRQMKLERGRATSNRGRL